MTRTTAILAGITLLLAFAYGQLWLFSLIDRTMERVEYRQTITMRDQKTGARYQCYSTKPKRSKR